jgi:hypothetical protein
MIVTQEKVKAIVVLERVVVGVAGVKEPGLRKRVVMV